VPLQTLKQLLITRTEGNPFFNLYYDLRLAYLPLLELPRVLDHLQAVATLAETLGDQRRLGSILASMAQ
jgi:hypothetical protein